MSSNINRIIIYWLLIVLSLLNNPLSLVIWDAKCVSILIFGKLKLKIGKVEIKEHNQRNSKKRVKSYVRERKHYKKVRGKRWRKHLSLPHKLLLHLLVLFWSNDSTPDDNSAPGVVLVSLSSVELDDSDSVSDNFVFFFFAGLECTLSFLGATFFGEGDLCFNETWPCMYVWP